MAQVFVMNKIMYTFVNYQITLISMVYFHHNMHSYMLYSSGLPLYGQILVKCMKAIPKEIFVSTKFVSRCFQIALRDLIAFTCLLLLSKWQQVS